MSDGCEEEEEEEGEAQVLLSDVPLEVVAVILQSLDPLSLAAAACVCRCASTAQHIATEQCVSGFWRLLHDNTLLWVYRV